MASRKVGRVPKSAVRGAAEFPPITIRQFIRKIRTLPAARTVVNPKKWYTTQKQHWLGWLAEYNTRGYYGRVAGLNRDARYAYNHIVEVEMLLWLMKAAKVPAAKVRECRAAAAKLPSLQHKSGAVRKFVPWEMVVGRLWKKRG